MPAPAAPPPKPTTPAPAAPAPAPAPVAAAPPKPAAPAPRQSANDELDSTFGTPKAAAPASPAKPVEAPVSTEDPVKAAAEPAAVDENEFLVEPKKPEEPDPAKEVAAAADQVPVKANELRTAYLRSKARITDLEKELSEIKAKPIEDGERKVFTEQITGLNKKLEELTGTLKVTAYEQSDEYKQKFETPFIDAWNEGVQQVATLTVTTEEGARKGTPEDFQAIMRESDNERAATQANEMFGANAFYVLSQRRELQKLNSARLKALSEYKSTMAERVKSEAEAAVKAKESEAQAQIQRVTAFKKLNDEAASKYPELFAPIEGDEEGNKMLERGYKDADLAFSGGAGLTPEQLIKLHSAIRNRAAAFGRLNHRAKIKDAKIAELEKVISELRGSTPGNGQVSRGEQPKGEMSFEDELEQIARRR